MGVSRWIVKLSRQGQRFMDIIMHAQKEGFSASELYRAFRQMGIRYSRTTLFHDWNVLGGYRREVEKMELIPRSRIIGEKYYAPVSRLKANYATTFRVAGINRQTGLPEIRYVTVLHDDLMRRDILEAKVKELFRFGEEEWGSPGFVIGHIAPVKGMRRV